MKKLGGLDAMFLYGETAKSPMHVGGLMHLELPAGRSAAAFFGDFREMIGSRLHLVDYLTHRLERVPYDVDHPVWVKDQAFDLDRHLRFVALPPDTALEAFAAEIYEPQMDQAHPLWEMWVIDLCEPGRVALLQKTHHAAIDGVSSQQAMTLLFDFTPEPRAVEPAPTDFWNEPRQSPLALWNDSLINLSRYWWDSVLKLPQLTQTMADLWQKELGGSSDRPASMPLDAPRVRFNDRIDERRAFRNVTMSLPKVKRLSRLKGVTINDVILTICSEGINRYLAHHGAEPREPLLASCLVSLHEPGAKEIRNRVSSMNVSMANDIQDLGARLNHISAAARSAKASLAEARALVPEDMGAPGLPALMYQLSRSVESGWPVEWLARMPVNLVVSNVPSFRQPLYVAGAKMTYQMPMSIVTHGAGLNLTVLSYLDRMDLGITAATQCVPDIDRLQACLVAAYEAVLAVADPVVDVEIEPQVPSVFASGGSFETEVITTHDTRLTVFKAAPANLGALFAEAADRYGDRTFFVYEEDRYSFQEAWIIAQSVARSLAAQGIEKGDRVGIAARNYPEWVFAFMGITTLGGIAVCLNAWWSREELEYGIDDAGIRFLFVDDERLERIGPIAQLRGLPLVTFRRSHPSSFPAMAWDEFLSQPANTLPSPEPVDADDPATILYTSGSTAAPKGVVSCHRALVHAVMAWEGQAAENRVRRHRRDNGPGQSAASEQARAFDPAMILTVPLFHVTGLNAQMLASFRFGRKLVAMYKWDAERALEIIERERITQFSGVPTMAYELIRSPSFEKFDTSSLKSMSGGGAAMAPKHTRSIEQMSKRRVAPGTGYGMTETNAIGTQLAGAGLLERPESVGRAIAPIAKVKIVDEDGREVAAGATGEVWIHGAMNFSGYWNRPEDTAAALEGGWVRTGDLGYLDEAGYLFITDRLKDLIIRGGENIGCAEVEAAILEHPAVRECVVFGIPDERLGETVAAVASIGAENLDEQALLRHLEPRLARFKLPQHVEIVRAKLPRIASGKIFRRGVREAFLKRLEDEARQTA